MKSKKKKQTKQALRDALVKQRDRNIFLQELGETIHAEHKRINEQQKEVMLPVLRQYIDSLFPLQGPPSQD